MDPLAAPAAGTLKSAAILLVAVLIPSSVATAIGGSAAGMAFGIAAGLVMAVSPFTSTAQAFGSAALAATLAALADLADDSPWAIAALMLVSAVLLALTNQRSAGLMTLAPIIVIIFGPASLSLTWQEGFAYVFAGGIAGWLIVRLFRFEAQPTPVTNDVAWRHALVLGVLSAAAVYWAMANDIPHGYWIAVTLVMALRPLPEQRASTLWGRLWGTLLGALLAFAAIVVLPVWLAAAFAAVCLLLLAAYSMSGNYFMQTLFLTPMLLVFATLGDAEKGITYTVERVWYTVVGVAIGALAAILLDRWDRAALARAGERDTPDPTPA